jgi:hypothetical protein
MSAARGDRKPCTHARCPGTMQFGREPLAASAGSTAHGALGWVCGENPDHFKRASELPSSVMADGSPLDGAAGQRTETDTTLRS